MDEDAPHDQFQAALSNYNEYPSKNTVVRTEIFGHALDSYYRRLKEKDVFHPDYRSLGLVDLHDGSQC